MIDRYSVIELSKLYKRILEVELTLKQKLFFALKETYSEKMFYRLVPYLRKIESNYSSNNKGKKSNKIQKIIDSDKTPDWKLRRFFEIAYISDVLNILTNYKDIYKYKVFQINFYGREFSEDDRNELITYTGKMIALRNAIMHFNINNYLSNRRDFLNTLIFWEKLLRCPNMVNIHKLSFNKKPKVTPILRALSDVYPDFFKLSDRLVCDMFDDAAFVNGWDVKDLPEYWTIGRQLYNLKRDNKILTD